MPHPSTIHPARVVSLLPSATEIVHCLGAAGRLVGRSHECDFPAELGHLPVLTSAWAAMPTASDPAAIDRHVRDSVGSGRPLYRLDTALLARLAPDLIVTQDLCDVCSVDLATVRGVAAGLRPVPAVLSLNPTTLEGVLDDVLRVGDALGLAGAAAGVVVGLRERLFAAEEHVNPFVEGPRVLFLEWTDPLFVGGHWIPQMVERAGGRHVLNPTVARAGSGAAIGPQLAERVAGKSVAVSVEAAAASEPEVVIVCPCGVGLEESVRQAKELRRAGWVGGAAVYAVDGNQMFSRPGPRLVEAFEFLVGILSGVPGLEPEGFPYERV